VIDVAWREGHQIWGQEKKCLFVFGFNEPETIRVDCMEVLKIFELLVGFRDDVGFFLIGRKF
jgi:hypothetical protein